MSPRYQFTVYRLTLAPDAGTASSAPPGLFVLVNNDDDNLNGVSDLNEAAAGEDDLIKLKIQIEPPMDAIIVIDSSDSTPPYRLWDSGTKTKQFSFPMSLHMPVDTVPANAFIEGQWAGTSKPRLQVTTNDKTKLNTVTMAITTVAVQVMNDTDDDWVPDAQTYFVRPGLWDAAWRLAGDAFGAADTLYNEEDQSRLAATNNPENFIGRDSRRFYFQITDPNRNTNHAGMDEIAADDFEFYTVKSDGSDYDHPATATITMTETGPDTGIFVSRSVLLVTDTVDLQQPTNSGVTAHSGNAAFLQANHRSRLISDIDNFVVAHYRPNGAAGPDFRIKIPVFQRSPDERKSINVHVYNFSDTKNFMVPAIPEATINSTLDVVRERYQAIGIKAVIMFDPVANLIDLPAGSAVNLNSVGPFTGGPPAVIPSTDQSALIALVRAKEPASPVNAHTIFALFVGCLADCIQGDRGESFPDGAIPPGSPAKNFVFIGGRAPMIATTPAHEIGHMLTNEKLTTEQANGTAPGWANGGHYGGPQADFNLMRDGTIDTTPPQVDDSKRLWDDSKIHVLRQIQLILNSTFVGPP